VLGAGQLATQKNIHYERLYVPRMSHTTGDVDAHELGVDAKDRLIFVNTKGLELEDNIKAKDGGPRCGCGAYIIDTRNGDIVHWIRFEGAVRELFDAAFIPGVRAPMCVGLGNPEMRTLITFPEDGSGSTAEAAA
jgi:hypothetical protein